jgi:hypothetical protein
MGRPRPSPPPAQVSTSAVAVSTTATARRANTRPVVAARRLEEGQGDAPLQDQTRNAVPRVLSCRGGSSLGSRPRCARPSLTSGAVAHGGTQTPKTPPMTPDPIITGSHLLRQMSTLPPFVMLEPSEACAETESCQSFNWTVQVLLWCEFVRRRSSYVNRLVKFRALLFHESIRPRYVKVARGWLWMAQATIATYAVISTLIDFREKSLVHSPFGARVGIFRRHNASKSLPLRDIPRLA